MSRQPKRNPFHELGLPVSASDDDVVEKSRDLVDTGTDDERRNALPARQELTLNSFHRARHELLEVPDTDYENKSWKRFAHDNRKNPVDLGALAADARPLRADDFDLRAVLGLLLDDLLAPPAVDIDPAVRHAPQPPAFGPPPIEVRDVIFG